MAALTAVEFITADAMSGTVALPVVATTRRPDFYFDARESGLGRPVYTELVVVLQPQVRDQLLALQMAQSVL
jgi:hypothetical protein